MKNQNKNEDCTTITDISIDSHKVLTLKGDVYTGQNLLLVMRNKMRVVEVEKICRTINAINIQVRDENNRPISLNIKLSDQNAETKLDWIVVSIQYIVERVMDKLKKC